MPPTFCNISFRDYLDDPAIDISGLKVFAQNPAKFKHWRDHGKPSTSTQLAGSALHCAILEPQKFEKRYGKGPAPRTGSAARSKWDKKNPWAMPLSPRIWDDVHSMVDAFNNCTTCTVAKDLLTQGTPELSIFWDDPATGLRCKMRPDWLRTDDIIVDLKSTVNGSPGGFPYEVRRWGYHYQAAFYMRGLTAAYQAAGINRQAEGFIFIAVESCPPHSVGCYGLPPDKIEEANQKIDGILGDYKQCLEENVWPGYADEILTLDI